MRTEESTGLGALARMLGDAKARFARRRLCAGEIPNPDDFVRHGLRMSAAESQAFAEWVKSGLHTRVETEHPAADGTVRLVIALLGGERIETVAMPTGTTCVSSQVGCAVGCRFCASGLLGVKKNLSVDEITEQVLFARRRLAVKRVVYMGMGEPTHNLENVLAAVARLRDWFGISPNRQVLSTVGSLAAFEVMTQAALRPCLALSLHTIDDRRRAELLVRAPRDGVRDLIAAADAYGRAMGMPIQIEWTLLKGVNDSLEEAAQLADHLAGVRACLNYIVYNPVDGLDYERVDDQTVARIAALMRSKRVYTTVRRSRGDDAEAACGQLRRRAVAAVESEEP